MIRSFRDREAEKLIDNKYRPSPGTVRLYSPGPVFLHVRLWGPEARGREGDERDAWRLPR